MEKGGDINAHPDAKTGREHRLACVNCCTSAKVSAHSQEKHSCGDGMVTSLGGGTSSSPDGMLRHTESCQDWAWRQR